MCENSGCRLYVTECLLCCSVMFTPSENRHHCFLVTGGTASLWGASSSKVMTAALYSSQLGAGRGPAPSEHSGVCHMINPSAPNFTLLSALTQLQADVMR